MIKKKLCYWFISIFRNWSIPLKLKRDRRPGFQKQRCFSLKWRWQPFSCGEMPDLYFWKAILVAMWRIKGFCKSIKMTAMINQVMADIRPYAMMYEEVRNVSQLSFSHHLLSSIVLTIHSMTMTMVMTMTKTLTMTITMSKTLTVTTRWPGTRTISASAVPTYPTPDENPRQNCTERVSTRFSNVRYRPKNVDELWKLQWFRFFITKAYWKVMKELCLSFVPS